MRTIYIGNKLVTVGVLAGYPCYLFNASLYPVSRKGCFICCPAHKVAHGFLISSQIHF